MKLGRMGEERWLRNPAQINCSVFRLADLQ